MKRLLLGLILLATATGASAEWTRAGQTVHYILYVDRATIRRDGNLVKMWDLKDDLKVDSESFLSKKSGKYQRQYDCKEEQSRELSYTWFDGQMGNGTPVFSYSDSYKWEPIVPGSIGETLWKIACGK